MSAQDKVEKALKDIHLLFAESPGVSGEPEKIIVEKQEFFALLERLTLSMYEVMDSYEATRQSRELARRRTQKQGEELVERATRQAEDVYAASLIYTDDALARLQNIITEASDNAKRIIGQMESELGKERVRMRENQSELLDQLKDFKDSNKYMVLMEDCNRAREKENQKKQGTNKEKRIQNEAKHYAMNLIPEIKVNPAYFERKGIVPPGSGQVPQEMGDDLTAIHRENDPQEGTVLAEPALLQKGLSEARDIQTVISDANFAEPDATEPDLADINIAGDELPEPDFTEMGIAGDELPEIDLTEEVLSELELSGEELPDLDLSEISFGEEIPAAGSFHQRVENGTAFRSNAGAPQNIPAFLEEDEPIIQKAEIKVDLDAEYFRWQAQKQMGQGNDRHAPEKRERRFLFGKKN